MRLRKQFFLLVVLAAVAALFLIPPGARADERDDGRAQVIVIDGNGDHHARSWVWGSGGWLGVTLTRDRDTDGAIIIDVAEDSPAARIGLQEGDIIVGLDGDEIDRPSDVTRHMRGLEPGDEVELEISRGGSRERLVAELDERPNTFAFFGAGDDAPFAFHFDGDGLEEHLRDLQDRLSGMDFNIQIPDIQLHGAPGFVFEFGGFGRPVLGVQTVQATPDLREHLGGPRDAGVLIGKIVEGMPAEEAGLAVGDLIVSVDGEEIGDSDDLRRALRGRSGETISLEIVRDGRTFDLEVRLPERDNDREFRRPSHPINHPVKEHLPTQKA